MSSNCPWSEVTQTWRGSTFFFLEGVVKIIPLAFARGFLLIFFSLVHRASVQEPLVYKSKYKLHEVVTKKGKEFEGMGDSIT